MRYTVLFMLGSLLLVQFTGKSQSLNFTGKDVPLHEFFKIIKARTGIGFFYDVSLLKDVKSVTVEWDNVPLENALNEILQNKPLTWIIEENTITIIKKTTTIIKKPMSLTEKTTAPPLILVQGKIADEEGNPMKSVSVIIKGTNKGTISDDAGRFSITMNPKNVLVFSCVNYNSKEVRVKKGGMNIQLQKQIKPIEELLAVGKINLTPMVSTSP